MGKTFDELQNEENNKGELYINRENRVSKDIEQYLVSCAKYERKAAYQDDIHTMGQITDELKHEGEECVGFHWIKRPQFETGITNLFQTLTRMYELMSKEKSSRMELYYNPEARSAEVNFYVPKDELEDKKQESDK